MSPSDTTIYARLGDSNKETSSGDSDDSVLKISRSRLEKLATSDGLRDGPSLYGGKFDNEFDGINDVNSISQISEK